MLRTTLISLLPVPMLMVTPVMTQAQSEGYEIDVRAIALFGDGVPANDIIGYGVGGRYYLSDGWFVSAGLEKYSYDFERPIKVVGLLQDPSIKDIDSSVDTTVLSVGLGRKNGSNTSLLNWFWDVGIGAGFPDAGSATGPLSTGGMFDVRTDTGTEFHLMGKLGATYNVSSQWALNVVARAEHHFIDFKVTDVTSGATGKVESQSPLGVNFSLSYRF